MNKTETAKKPSALILETEADCKLIYDEAHIASSSEDRTFIMNRTMNYAKSILDEACNFWTWIREE